jgi:hypothetical protein
VATFRAHILHAELLVHGTDFYYFHLCHSFPSSQLPSFSMGKRTPM